MAAADPPGADEQQAAGGQDGAARLAEEIRLLVELVAEHALPWLDELLAAGHGAPHASYAGNESHPESSGAPRAAACEWCPLCAVIAVARGQRPEFAVRLFEQAAQLVALLRAVLADRWEPDEGVHIPGFRPTGSAASQQPRHQSSAARSSASQSGPSSRVQHITVRRRGDADPGTE